MPVGEAIGLLGAAFVAGGVVCAVVIDHARPPRATRPARHPDPPVGRHRA